LELTNKQTNKMTTLATYWSMTINNPDETDMVLVRNPNDKYVRILVWSPEEGADGTPHIQGWLRLQRNNSLAFVRKLYPRAHFRHILKDEYNENTQRYAQKDDKTSRGQHTISVNDPIPALDTTLYRVLERVLEDAGETIWANNWEDKDIIRSTKRIESTMVTEKSGLEKIFISNSYHKMKLQFWQEILVRLSRKKQEEQNVEIPVYNADDHTHEDGDDEEGGLRETSGEEDSSQLSEGEGSDDGEGSDEDSESSAGS